MFLHLSLIVALIDIELNCQYLWDDIYSLFITCAISYTFEFAPTTGCVMDMDDLLQRNV